jgi:hypothetical protein
MTKKEKKEAGQAKLYTCVRRFSFHRSANATIASSIVDTYKTIHLCLALVKDFEGIEEFGEIEELEKVGEIGEVRLFRG